MSSCVESVLSLAHAVTCVRLSLLLDLMGLALQFNCPKQTAPPKPRSSPAAELPIRDASLTQDLPWES